jgi:hypothetical protein
MEKDSWHPPLLLVFQSARHPIPPERSRSPTVRTLPAAKTPAHILEAVFFRYDNSSFD